MSQYGGYEDDPFVAELYDLIPGYTGRGDVDFYLHFCREAGGPVLELGCGTGRVLIPIAREGHQITGLDLSEFMLDICRAKMQKEPEEVRQKIELVQGNMTEFDLNKSYSLAIIPFRPFQHLIKASDHLACLKAIFRHLKPGGRFILDIFNPGLEILSRHPQREAHEDIPEFELPDGRKLRRTTQVTAIDRAEQYMDIEFTYYLTMADGTGKLIIQTFPFRYLFRYEVEHLLARCGFKIIDLFGDYDFRPYTGASPEMLFLAEKPAD